MGQTRGPNFSNQETQEWVYKDGDQVKGKIRSKRGGSIGRDIHLRGIKREELQFGKRNKRGSKEGTRWEVDLSVS